MRRIQSFKVWRDKNSRQREIHTKVSKAVKKDASGTQKDNRR